MTKVNIKNFIFFIDPPWDERKVFRTLIPSSIKSEEMLHKYFASLFQIGGYYGHNWSAMDEVLSDLEWIKEYEIEIIHDGLLLLPEDKISMYLQILSESVDFWNGKGVNAEFLSQRKFAHKLNIYFPESCKEELLQKIN